MSSADFAAELEQSVQSCLDSIVAEAEAAKARVFARVALARPVHAEPAEAVSNEPPVPPAPRAAVSFDDPFDAALAGASAPVNVFEDVDANP